MFLGLEVDIMLGVSFNELSNSLNSNFTETQVFGLSERTLFIIVVITIIALIVFFAWYADQEKKAQRRSYELYQERKKMASSASSGAQQDRKWFRLRTKAPFRWITSEELAKKVKEKNYHQDHLVDISGDGLCFSTALSLNIDDDLRFFLDGGDGELLSMNGHVVRIVDKTEDDKPMFDISVKFNYLLPGERDKIVAWILQRQRDGMQTGDKKAGPLSPFSPFPPFGTTVGEPSQDITENPGEDE